MSRILLVEDDLSASEVFRLCLEELGHEVAVCHDVPSAVAFIEGGEPVDIAFVDYWLVTETAEKVLKSLREKRAGVPVVLISGGSKTVSVETTKWLGAIDGAQGFLQKPFSVREIQALIRRFE
ncbi:response regulator [Paracoccus sp. (in: a-proteobacteria)]|uniref:response regulator n=1 Tax=Paracoccus sp. TaxID=267 RepID=UPI003A849587